MNPKTNHKDSWLVCDVNACVDVLCKKCLKNIGDFEYIYHIECGLYYILSNTQNDFKVRPDGLYMSMPRCAILVGNLVCCIS